MVLLKDYRITAKLSENLEIFYKISFILNFLNLIQSRNK